MVITMAKLRMAHASTHGARKPPGPIYFHFFSYDGFPEKLSLCIWFPVFNLTIICLAGFSAPRVHNENIEGKLKDLTQCCLVAELRIQIGERWDN